MLAESALVPKSIMTAGILGVGKELLVLVDSGEAVVIPSAAVQVSMLQDKTRVTVLSANRRQENEFV